jgi:2-methylcitrate dehydratase PrpD
MTDPVVDKIVARVASGAVPDSARTAAKTFIADTLGVGIVGIAAPWRAEVLAASAGGPPEAIVICHRGAAAYI